MGICRQKKEGQKAYCSQCSAYWCGGCLDKRHAENILEVCIFIQIPVILSERRLQKIGDFLYAVERIWQAICLPSVPEHL